MREQERLFALESENRELRARVRELEGQINGAMCQVERLARENGKLQSVVDVAREMVVILYQISNGYMESRHPQMDGSHYDRLFDACRDAQKVRIRARVALAKLGSKPEISAIEAKDDKVTVYPEKGEVLIIDNPDEGVIE